MWLCLDGACGNVNPDSAKVCTVCGSAAVQVRLFEPGTMIGAYEIRRFVGHGGYGVVYEAARRSADGRLLDIALKQTSLADYRTLDRELNLLRGVSNPGLPVYYEAFQHGGSGYLAMEFVQGQNLRELLTHAGDALGEKQVVQYALELCGAVAALHALNPPVLHRDIKPANVRLTPQGRIKLVDFGLTKAATEMTRTAQQGATPGYAAWEQLTGSGTDVRSDIYSIGATLYHLLTNHYPATALERGMSGPDALVPPEQLNPDLSRDIVAVIRRAMERKPEARYQSVAEMERALRKASRESGPVQRTPSGRPAPSRQPTSESARRIAGAATVSLSNALFGFVSGMVSGAVAGAVGGFGGWVLWTLTHWGSMAGLGEVAATFDGGGILSFFGSRISPWIVTSSFLGAIIAALLGLLMTFLGAGETRSVFARMLISFVSALWAVLWGIFLTFAHLLVAAIPFGLFGWLNQSFNIVLLRQEPTSALLQDIGYWAAVGAVGWAIALAVDRPTDRDLAARRFSYLTRLLIGALQGVVALGGGSYIVWLVLSGASVAEALNPLTLFAHLRNTAALPVGLVGGLLIALMRTGRRTITPAPVEPAAAPTVPVGGR